MSRILVLGAGVAGLSAAMLLTREGHDVTVLEKDAAPPPPPGRAPDAWQGWTRRGVAQFRMPHYLLPRWWAVTRSELPDVPPLLLAAGAAQVNQLADLPSGLRGPLREGDDRFATVTARRPVFEAALAGAAVTTGVDIRRAVRVVGLTTDAAEPAPRVTGVRTEDGEVIGADLVVDCSGRRSGLASWLADAGARPPHQTRADCGLVYYARHFRSRSGQIPQPLAAYRQDHDSLSILTLPADNGTWSVVLTVSSKDRALRALRDPDRWAATLAAYPLAAHWADAEPISGVDVMAGIEDRQVSLTTAEGLVATGVVAVGDSWGCTSPSVGRGTSMAVMHACLLRDLLREVDPSDHLRFARAFADRTEATMAPQYAATRWLDDHRLAELDADAAGRHYEPDDQRWNVSKAMVAAGRSDSDVLRAQLTVSSFLAPAGDALQAYGVLDPVLAASRWAPQYPLPGPRRPELLRAIGAGPRRGRPALAAGSAGYPAGS